MKTRLRIVHAATYVHPDRAGGAERVIADLAAGQAELGHDVTVVSCAEPQLPARETRRGFVHVRRPLDPGLRGLAFVRAVRATIRDAIAREAPFDVLHTHQIASAAAAQRAAPRGVLRVHAFYAPYADESEVERGPSWTQRIRAGVARWLDRRALAAADTILVLSEFSREQVAALAPKCLGRVREVHPGIDTSRFFAVPASARVAAARRLGAPPGARLVVSVRRLVKRMGLDIGLDAFAAVARTDADCQFWIAGDGPEREALSRRARDLGIEDRVRLLGRVDEGDLPDLLRAAEVFLLPTRALEGFGMATLEALACGTSVVATDAGATPQVLARLAPEFTPVPCSAATLAAALRERLADPARARAIAERAAVTIAREHGLAAAAAAVQDATRPAQRSP